MAQMTQADRAALEAGYAESERCARAYGRAQYVNPHPWGSRLHRMFEFGYYIHEKGLTLGAREYWQTGRGGLFTSPAGHQFKLWCDKGGLGILRIA